MNTIYILWLRQVKRYFRSRSRLLGSLAQPTLFLISFGFGFSSVYQKAGEGNYLQYLAPGIILMSVLMTGIFSGIDLIWDREFGFLKETLVAPVSRLAIVFGKTLGGATVAIIQGLLVFALTLLLGFRPINYWLLPVALAFVTIVALLFTCLGITIASMLEDMQGFQLIMNFLVMPTVFLSGAFFSVADLPATISWITKINPLTYGMDGLRSALINQSLYHPVFDFSLLLFITGILLVLGSYLFQKIEL